MRDDLFNELLESVRQGGAIIRGDLPPSRTFHFADEDVKELRERMKLSQPRFAAMLGISLGTLRNWEQGRRKPEGPARALLRVASVHPEAVLDALSRPLEPQPGRDAGPSPSPDSDPFAPAA
ncbi:MAG TPA: helix-turn-helix domain-containing protein [Longimicrobium sp.]|nr:helix-turn-helix domain-containing protein [Longimicrobium sp.]